MLCQAFSQPTWAEGTQVIAKLRLSVLLVMISMCNFQALTNLPPILLQDHNQKQQKKVTTKIALT